MSKLNFAAIDIGTNAARLLIKGIREDEQGKELSKLLLLRVPLRLGQDVFTCGKISEKKEYQLIHLIKAFCELMQVYHIHHYRACATSAMRDAENGTSIAEKIGKECGIHIEIISGHEEASLLYSGHAENLFNTRDHYICVDVGGGSTEISRIENGHLVSTESYNIGTLRLLHEKTEQKEIERLHKDLLSLHDEYDDIQIIGSGGNINKLFRISETEAGNPLTIKSLEKIYRRLKKMDIRERIEKLHLKPDRADVIVPAASLFLDIARHVGAEQINVPTLGLVDGIVYALYQKYLSEDA